MQSEAGQVRSLHHQYISSIEPFRAKYNMHLPDFPPLLFIKLMKDDSLTYVHRLFKREAPLIAS